MYSWQIDKLLSEKQYVISRQDYEILTDTVQNPQINNVKYNPYDDKFSLSTTDGFSWTFTIN